MLFFAMAGLFILSACNAGENPQGETSSDYKSKPITVKDSAEQPVDKETGQQISKHLVDIASRIPDVNDATAVVLGNYAIVGIDVESGLDRNKVESIKYAVAESLKNDPHGANAIVVADADTNQRLKQMGKEIQQGRPVAGVMDELAAIIGRVIPDVPGDTIDNPEKEPTEQDNDQLPEKQQNELDRSQNRESKNELKRNQ
ncbi:YhcN/YlaJ family sporulation lipoprotein [Bacillus mangrovi]|uniref:YhcN/YlaJ family sporulation lipoprotein n=2 Tax=Metabacillus mangrovi TaxID=1491830 RepID=A0A7X2S3H5_9BACI|nr:YhcN/YlaJ family sporulation lipoprotein [Metabacillus mangrovi]